ncbi:MAG: hypothetical protein QME81_19795 [bacterium]|nr:hypothetical protein [bacterium]
MSVTMSSGLRGQVASELTRLPEEDLSLVIEFVKYLERRRETSEQRLSPVEIRAKAQRRVALLEDVPREKIVVRFRELAEDIRQEAIAKGTAVEGDWQGD